MIPSIGIDWVMTISFCAGMIGFLIGQWQGWKKGTDFYRPLVVRLLTDRSLSAQALPKQGVKEETK